MAQLRQDHDQFVQRETAVVVVGPEGPEAFRRYWEEHRLPFQGLPDPSHSVLKRYGQEVKIFKLGRMPAQVLIDKQGVARFIHYGHAMSDIPSNQEILAAIDGLDAEVRGAPGRGGDEG